MRIKEIHYIKITDGYANTGLYLVAENGEIFRHHSTDPIETFSKADKLPEEDLISSHKGE